MAYDFLDQVDQDIRSQGIFYRPQQKYLQNNFQSSTQPTETETISETQDFGIPYTNAFTGSGGGGGGGKFGNQDMSDMKEFTMPGFDKPVRGWRNTSTGMYQDIDGLNIQNLGIKVQPMFAKALNAFGFDMDDGEDPKYPGYFTKNNLKTLMKNPASFKHFYDRQDKDKQDALDKQLATENEAAANRGKIEAYTGQKMSDDRSKRPRSEQNYTGGDKQMSDPIGGFENKSGMGRTGYFFGGRTGFAKGGRQDQMGGTMEQTASELRAAAPDQFGGGMNINQGGGDNNTTPTTTFFNNPEIIKEETMFGEMPAGVGFNNDYGRYKAVMDLRNSIKNQNVEGEIEYNNTVGDFDFGGKYNTEDGTTYGASYNNNGLGVNYNNIAGTSASYNKGPFSISTDGDNTTAGFKWTYKNGGLAGLL